jgi:hypothetical protein
MRRLRAICYPELCQENFAPGRRESPRRRIISPYGFRFVCCPTILPSPRSLRASQCRKLVALPRATASRYLTAAMRQLKLHRRALARLKPRQARVGGCNAASEARIFALAAGHSRDGGLIQCRARSRLHNRAFCGESKMPWKECKPCSNTVCPDKLKYAWLAETGLARARFNFCRLGRLTFLDVSQFALHLASKSVTARSR